MVTIKDRIKDFRRVRASDIAPSKRNWRKHPPAQQRALEATLAEIGFADALLVRETPEGLELIDGHLRRETVGDQEVPVLILDVDENEANALLVTLDPLAGMATADKERLNSLVSDLTVSTTDFQTVVDGFAADAGIKREIEVIDDEPPSFDRAKELCEKWGTERGQVWLIASHTQPEQPHRIMCGDATRWEDVDKLRDGAAVHMCFTSPPYNLGTSINMSGNKAMSARGSAYVEHDDKATDWRQLMDGWVAQAFRFCELTICNVQMLSNNKRDLICWIFDNRDRLAEWITWDKGHASFHGYMAGMLASQFEWLIVFGGKNATRRLPFASWQGGLNNVYNGPPQRQNHFSDCHAATMPMHLPTWVLGTLCDQAQTIYEPFAGTGTTIVAAEQLARRCYAMEIDPSYVAICLERLDNFGCQPQRME